MSGLSATIVDELLGRWRQRNPPRPKPLPGLRGVRLLPCAHLTTTFVEDAFAVLKSRLSNSLWPQGLP